MNLAKVDPYIWNRVGVYAAEKNFKYCIVYVKNFVDAHTKIQKLIHENELMGEYPFINAFAVKINFEQISELSGLCWVDYIATVQTTKILINKARKVIKVDELHKKGVLGTNVGVAVIDTGCYPHLDFLLGKNRIKKFVDMVDDRITPYDDNGHGTFVTGVLCGSGFSSGGIYRGIAPDCDLYAIKALNSDGQTQAFKVLDAMQWVYENAKKYNIRVVCMSFGSTPLSKNDPLSLGASSLWDNGIVVVSAAGNDGPKAGTIKSPGSCAKIITVGCADTTSPEIKIADFSSRGPIFNLIKPDIVAPGVNISSLDNSVKLITQMTGTSVSTPFVAGVCALLLQQNPELTPNKIKAILLNNAIKLPYDVEDCGAGLLSTF